MTNSIDHSSDFAIGRIEDGSYICVSRSTPRFAVGALTREEVVAKAHRALDFYHEFDLKRSANVRTIDLEPCEAA